MEEKSIKVKIGGNGAQPIEFSNEAPLKIICGPCSIEGRDLALSTAEEIATIANKLNIGIVYKSSFDKANRTSGKSKRGVGIDEGLKILEEVRSTFSLPILTDIHKEEQAQPVSEVADILQIPAMLCRQTDLIVAACQQNSAVNIKKGQFLSPEEMLQVCEKAVDTGQQNVLLTERGTTFGYNNLVTDFRCLQTLKSSKFPVIFDATHSVQMPGGGGTTSSGRREFVECLARASVSIGISGVFMECHPNPEKALSDGPNMVPLDQLEGLISNLIAFDKIAKSTPYQPIF